MYKIRMKIKSLGVSYSDTSFYVVFRLLRYGDWLGEHGFIDVLLVWRRADKQGILVGL